MFEKLVQKLKKMMPSDRPQVDPAQFGDPVALQTQWTPAKSGGASFATHKMVQSFGRRLEFRMSMGARLFCLVFLLVGLGVLTGGIVTAVNGAEQIALPIFMCIFGSTFAAAGGGVYYFMNKPIVFDKASGYYWRGRVNPQLAYRSEQKKDFVALEDIHAIQLISEYCSSKDSSYYSYEINLVVKDASRVHVIDHGNLPRIRDNAQSLSEFLDVPIWDAI